MPGMKATMDEWKAGKLRSGSKTGPVVKDQKQAIAIALSEEKREGKRRLGSTLSKLASRRKKPKQY